MSLAFWALVSQRATFGSEHRPLGLPETQARASSESTLSHLPSADLAPHKSRYESAVLKMCRVWLEDSGCSNKPSEVLCSISHHRRGELVFCASGLSGPRQGGGFLQVWSQARGLGFAAQFTANDRAPAGRDMTDPLGLHMCGWAKRQSQMFLEFPNRMQNC